MSFNLTKVTVLLVVIAGLVAATSTGAQDNSNSGMLSFPNGAGVLLEDRVVRGELDVTDTLHSYIFRASEDENQFLLVFSDNTAESPSMDIGNLSEGNMAASIDAPINASCLRIAQGDNLYSVEMMYNSSTEMQGYNLLLWKATSPEMDCFDAAVALNELEEPFALISEDDLMQVRGDSLSLDDLDSIIDIANDYGTLTVSAGCQFSIPLGVVVDEVCLTVGTDGNNVDVTGTGSGDDTGLDVDVGGGTDGGVNVGVNGSNGDTGGVVNVGTTSEGGVNVNVDGGSGDTGVNVDAGTTPDGDVSIGVDGGSGDTGVSVSTNDDGGVDVNVGDVNVGLPGLGLGN